MPKKNKKRAPLSVHVPDAPEYAIATKNAAWWGHALVPFKKNGDVHIAACSTCEALAIIHEDPNKNGRHSGTALNFKCRKP